MRLIVTSIYGFCSTTILKKFRFCIPQHLRQHFITQNRKVFY